MQIGKLKTVLSGGWHQKLELTTCGCPFIVPYGSFCKGAEDRAPKSLVDDIGHSRFRSGAVSKASAMAGLRCGQRNGESSPDFWHFRRHSAKSNWIAVEPSSAASATSSSTPHRGQTIDATRALPVFIRERQHTSNAPDLIGEIRGDAR